MKSLGSFQKDSATSCIVALAATVLSAFVMNLVIVKINPRTTPVQKAIKVNCDNNGKTNFLEVHDDEWANQVIGATSSVKVKPKR